MGPNIGFVSDSKHAQQLHRILLIDCCFYPSKDDQADTVDIAPCNLK